MENVRSAWVWLLAIAGPVVILMLPWAAGDVWIRAALSVAYEALLAGAIWGRGALLRRQYLQYVRGRWYRLDGPFSSPLLQVYVALRLVPRLRRTSDQGDLLLNGSRASGGTAIWAYLWPGQVKGQGLVVTGDLGSGKSTLLRHTALTLASGRRARRAVAAPNKLPVLLSVHDTTLTSLVKVAQAQMDRAGYRLPGGWLEQELRSGRCLVLLDGLDEVADPSAVERTAAWIETQMARYPKTRFLIASQTLDYRRSALRKAAVLEIRPLVREQIEAFAERWTAGRGETEALIRALGQRSDLATVPLHLTMLATLNDAGQELPQTRADLFAAYCKLILDRARGEMAAEQTLHLLELLAYRMITDRSLVLALSEVARVSAVSGDALVNSSGRLLVRDTEGQCRFVHAAIQCYLAAAYAVKAQLVAELEARAIAPDIWWHQTIRFYASLSDASSIVLACLQQTSPTPEVLGLLVSCVRESKDLPHGVQRRFEGMLQVWIEDADPHRRQAAAEALLSLRLDRFGSDNVSQHLVTHAEYQVFLDERRERGRYLQPDHWLDYRFPSGLGTRPVVGVRLSDAAGYCEWLTQRDDGGWHYRLPHVGEGKKHAAAGSWTLSGEGEDAACIEGAPALEEGCVEQYVVLTLARDLARAHGRDHDLERARTIAAARASDLSRMPTRVSVSASDLDRALSRARTSDVTLSRAQDVALARAIDLTVSLARERSDESGLDLTRARAFAALGERLIDPDLANDLASAIDRARDRVVDRAIDRVLGNVISLDLARASEVAARLSRSLDGARGLVDAIDQARACAARLGQSGSGAIVRAADQARDLSRAVAQAGDAAHGAARQLTERVERGLVRAGELAEKSDLAEALNLPTVIDRARTLSLARARDLAGVGDFGVASDQVGALALDLDLARTRTSELATHVTRESADSLIYALARTASAARDLSLAFSLANDLDSDVTIAGVLSRASDQMPALSADYCELTRSWRWHVRLQMLALAVRLYHQSNKPENERLYNVCLGLYIDLAILEGRIQGSLPAYEGIRLVREPVPRSLAAPA